MKIEIYRSNWFNLDGYWACKVRYMDGSAATILQHREVMEKHLGRKLLPDEVIHHKDQNRSNNDLSNLEVKTKSQHAREHIEEKGGPSYIDLICVRCNKSFQRLERDFKHNRKLGKRGPFCGKSCAGKGEW